jgi:hypothetical protein
MAKIEDLIAQIADERLRNAVIAEVRELKKNKKFGLVFEEHLPETVRLPNLQIKQGDLVAKRRETGNELWRVKSIRKGITTLERAIEDDPVLSEMGIEVPVTELVVVRSFGDPIYPTLVPVDCVKRGGPEKPWHFLINADNFHALQLLLYAYEAKVDVIYIDPPYNSGARDWKYNNDYVDKTDSFRHSKWLSMMKKRLLLARRLLRKDEHWELRHARRRGNESSYRHQRKNQFYPIYINVETRTVEDIGDSIPLDEEPNFKKRNGLTPIWPIDKEGNHRCWRFIPSSKGLAKFADGHHFEFGRLIIGRKKDGKLQIVDVSDAKVREKARKMGAPADLEALFDSAAIE